MKNLFSVATAMSLWLVMIASAQAAGGNVAAGQAKAAVCAGCHGADGNGGADPLWPKLAGQDAEYIAKQLGDFKSGARKDPIMAGMAAALSKTDMKNIGAYYESLKAKPGAARDAQLAKLGEKTYRGGNAKMGVSACMSCHGPTGHGIPPRFPKVSGQNAAYTNRQLLAFKTGSRTNDGDIMTRIAFRMSEQEIKAVSEYMAGLH
ncbi:MAG: cytochrome c4 [Sulfuricaulis sp.]|uniref:c-type cytochrome n=1 Tax=Sulfuricaulis sp. TaxID=2003553 RepID=UPI0025DFEB4A|nr:c-type cytochrome [Sulfuricaulis sp.]MCR4347855.1 cytochrome c4 [Sulfuricaulis sp.]